MSAPKQTYGLTNFAFSISKCPPNPDAIRSIVFTKCDNLAVVNGASTEILIPLTKLFIPVDNASRLSFSLPGSTENLPIPVSKLDLGGLDLNGEVKFIGLLPEYGTGSTSTASQYIEWTYADSLDKYSLYDELPEGPSQVTGLDATIVNKLEFSFGGYISFTGGDGTLWAATNGGLLGWDGTNMKLWNTLNSNSPSDFMTSIAVSSYGMWIGTSGSGIAKFDSVEGFTKSQNTLNSQLPSNVINDMKFMPNGRLAIATDLGLSIFDQAAANPTWINTNIYNTPSLLYNKLLNIQITSDPYIFAGTTGGVFMYDVGASAWGATVYNSTNTPGWTLNNNVQCLEVFDGNLYVGTSQGLVVVPYAGGTATVYTTAAGPTGGPISNDIRSIRYSFYQGDKIYMGHDDGFSIFNLDTATFSSADSSTYSWLASGVSDILPDYLNDDVNAETVLFGSSTTTYGLAKLHVPSQTFSVLPGDTDVTNLLLAYPGYNPYKYSPSGLVANNQPLYFMFSKTMNQASVQNSTFLGLGLTGAGGTVGGSWVWDPSGRQAAFYPGGLTSSYLSVAVSYTQNNSIVLGPEAVDNVYPGQQVTGYAAVANTIVAGVTSSGNTTIVQLSKGVDPIVTPGETYTFTRSNLPLQKSQIYNIRVSYGSVATDGTYLRDTLNSNFYTESIVPFMQWQPLGKMFVLSGTEGNYTQGIYLRNPNKSSVNITALLGR